MYYILVTDATGQIGLERCRPCVKDMAQGLILSRIQTNTFVDCAAQRLTVLFVLPRRCSLVFSVLF